jgi:hypothetical protein
MKSTRLSSQYTISRKKLIVSSEGAQIDLTESKVSAAFLCVDKTRPGMMMPFRRGGIYYAEYLENYYPNCPVKWARHAWHVYHDDAAFPYVITAEEIKKFFKRFA